MTIKPLVFTLRLGIMLSSLAALGYCIMMYQSGTADLDAIALNPQATEKASDMLIEKALAMAGVVGDRVMYASKFLTDTLKRMVEESWKDQEL